jgi:hypothetical protein
MRIVFLILLPICSFCQNFNISTTTSLEVQFAPIKLVRISQGNLTAALVPPAEAGRGLLEQNLFIGSMEIYITCSSGNTESLALSFTGQNDLELLCSGHVSPTESGSYTLHTPLIASGAPTVILTTSDGLVTGHQLGTGIPFEFQITRHPDYGFLHAGDLLMQLQYELL